MLRARPHWVVFAVALVVRVGQLGVASGSPLLEPVFGDQAFYHAWALKILGGAGFDGRALYGLPGYPAILAALYAVATPDAFVPILVQGVLDAVTAAVVFEFARRALPAGSAGWGGVVAAAGWILLQPAQAFGLTLMPTAWVTCAGWLVMLGLLRWVPGRGPWVALALGLGIGLVATVVATILLLVPVAWVRFVGLHPRAPRWWLVRCGLLVFGVAIGTAPCWVYNRWVAKEPVWLSAHSGLNFFLGNNGVANGYTRVPPELSASQRGMLADSIRVAEAAAGRPLSRAEVSRYWEERARGWIRENRGAWLVLVGRKASNFFAAFEYDDLSHLSIVRRDGWLTPGLRFGWLAVLGLPGLVLALARGNAAARLAAAGVLAQLAALLPVFVTERYRLPAAPGLIVLSVFAAAAMAGAWRGRRRGMLAAMSGGVGLAAALVFWPRTSPELRFHDRYNLALRLLAGDRAAEARALLEPVAAAAPRNPEVVFALGNSLLGSGDAAGAMAVYRRVIDLAPGHQGAWNNLGAAALEAGAVGEAREVLARALELDRDDPKTVVLAAEAALAAGDRAGAEGLVRAGLGRHPGHRRMRELGERLGVSGE